MGSLWRSNHSNSAAPTERAARITSSADKVEGPTTHRLHPTNEGTTGQSRRFVLELVARNKKSSQAKINELNLMRGET